MKFNIFDVKFSYYICDSPQSFQFDSAAHTCEIKYFREDGMTIVFDFHFFTIRFVTVLHRYNYWP